MRRPRRGLLRERFERALFSVMGPADLGDPDAPVILLPTGPVDRCRQCGGPRDEHEIVRSPGLTYTRCAGRSQAP